MNESPPAVAEAPVAGRKKLSIQLFKLLTSLCFLGYIIWDVLTRDPATFARLREAGANWSALALAWSCFVAALMAGWTRWCLLGRALGLRFSLRAAFRLGFLGYLLDFLAFGTVGGDAARAVLLAREQDNRWLQAGASVVLNRVVGLLGLSIVASAAVLQLDAQHLPVALQTLVWATLASTAAGLLVLLALLVPNVRDALVARIPSRTGSAAASRLAQTLAALQLYSRRPRWLALISLLGLGVPCLNIAGFYMTASALPGPSPSLGDHFIIIPPAMLSGAIPLPMEALGVFETVVEYLYAAAMPAAAVGHGLLVALTYRVLSVAIAVLGAPVYLAARRALRSTSREAAARERAS